MKIIKMLVFAIFLLATSNSCMDDPSNPHLDPPSNNWHTENLEVKAMDWKLSGPENGIGSYYEYIFYGFPYVDGIINVYLYQNFSQSNEVQIPLPYTYYGVEVMENGQESYYSIQYSYDIAVDGSIALKIHLSDYLTSTFRPGTEYFRVAITW
ncbi:MAG: hypothetical protein LBH60_01080 [Prevotellaceae bacterium]|jgi:hypothetical protein|nr:hypothetical protein [Prevotellaceae bacterium]